MRADVSAATAETGAGCRAPQVVNPAPARDLLAGRMDQARTD
jgi:hypothetical protein